MCVPYSSVGSSQRLEPTGGIIFFVDTKPDFRQTYPKKATSYLDLFTGSIMKLNIGGIIGGIALFLYYIYKIPYEESNNLIALLTIAVGAGAGNTIWKFCSRFFK